MDHFTAIESLTRKELEELISIAQAYKGDQGPGSLDAKTLITLFFNPSTRTKTSFDLAMKQLGGHSVCLEPGGSSWGMEVEEGAVMDGTAEEHLKDALGVLERYGDAVAVRCFPKFVDWEKEKDDTILKNMTKWATKPIINMETITHPCQALAMAQTIKEHLGGWKGKKIVVSWAYHPKPLNTAVANSAGVIAAMLGMDVTIANPPGYDLDPYYLQTMSQHAEMNGSTFQVVHDQGQAMEGADIVYAKSWGSLAQYGNYDKTIQDLHKGWTIDEATMAKTDGALFSHCLPVRRNMIVTDAVIDSPKSVVLDEAENRLHVQKAVLWKLLGGSN